MRHRHFRLLGYLGMCVALGATTVQAQTPRRSEKEIGQIITAALHAITPPWERHANASISERGIRFDYTRTLAAFGYADDPTTRGNLGLERTLIAGSDSLIMDCDQVGSKLCSRLGRSVYIHLEPTSISNSEIVLWVHVAWAGSPPNSKRVFGSFSSTEVILSRSGSGLWTFVRLGKGVIS